MARKSSRNATDGAASRALTLSELSWPEVEEFSENVEIVLIPFGSTEQHGPNLAVSADAAIAEAFCKLASKKMFPRLLVAPTVSWGVSPHHMDFPGTITLSAGTLLQLYDDIASSLVHHGFRRILIVNAHGGNRDISGVVAVELGERYDLDFVGAVYLPGLVPEELNEKHRLSERVGHACELEVSDALFLCPEIVKKGAIAPGDLREEGWPLRNALRKHDVRSSYSMADITHNGALGDATHASVEAGKARIEAALDSLAELVEAIAAGTGVPTAGSR